MSTVAGLITLVREKTLRTDKDTTILAGINWVKNDLCAKGGNTTWKRAEDNSEDITLVKGQIAYSLPSDFHKPDVFEYEVSQSQKWDLNPVNYGSIDPPTNHQGYSTAYCIKGSTVYIGCPVPGFAHTVRVFYYHKPSDYAAASTSTPVFADKYGDDAYIFGAEWYLWDTLGDQNRALVALSHYEKEKAKISFEDFRKGSPVVQSNLLF